jgi:hypothetical protein
MSKIWPICKAARTAAARAVARIFAQSSAKCFNPASHIVPSSVQYRRTFKVGQQIANESKPLIDSLGRGVRAFQFFKFYKPPAKNLYKRLGNLPFHACIHHFLML